MDKHKCARQLPARWTLEPIHPTVQLRSEQEMRALEFRPWHVAIRIKGLIELSPEIEHNPLRDLATTEFYSAWISKKMRPT